MGSEMALGDAELIFFISNGIMLILFIVLYLKLYKKPEISRVRKVIYAIAFPALVTVITICILIFHISMSWDEALMFNVIWILFFLIMLQDIAGNPLMQKIPFGRLFLVLGLMILLVVSVVISLLDFVWFLSMGEWTFPLPIFIVSTLIIIPLLILISQNFQKVEEQSTEGAIVSGGRYILHLLGFTFGAVLITIGVAPIIVGEVSMIPSHIGIVLLVIGIILTLYNLFYIQQERRQRAKAGFA